jgi:hypothetical protein
MSKIPSRDIFKDDLSFKNSVEPILNSPYTTVYEKPLRIMTINSNGEENIEVTTTSYKTINDTISIDKITQICENIILDKMLGKEKSLLSQLLFRLGEQVLEVEKRILDNIDLNMELKFKQQNLLEPLEKEIFNRLDNSYNEKLKLIMGGLLDDIEKSNQIQQNYLLNYISKQIKDEMKKEMGGVQSNLKKMVELEVKNALDNMTKSDMEEENCQDVLCDLPELEKITEQVVVEEYKDLVNTVVHGVDLIIEKLPTESELLKDLSKNNFEFIDENLLTNGEDLIFDIEEERAKEENEKVEEAVVQEVEKVEEAVVQEVEKVEEAVVQEVEKVEQAVVQEVEKVEQAVVQEVEKIEEAVVQEVDKVEEAVVQELERVEEAVVQEVEKIEEEVVQEVEKVEQAVVQEVERIEESVVQEVEKVEESVVQEVEKVEEAVVQEVERVEEAVVQEVERIEEAVVQEVERIEEAVVQEVERVEESVAQELERVEDSVVQEVERVEESVVQEVEKVEESVVQEVERIEEAVVQEVERVEEAVVQEVEKVEEDAVQEVEMLVESVTQEEEVKLVNFSTEDISEFEPIPEKKAAFFEIPLEQSLENETKEVTKDTGKRVPPKLKKSPKSKTQNKKKK